MTMPASRPLLALMILLAFSLATPSVVRMPGDPEPWFVEGDVACGRVALVFTIGLGGQPSETILHELIQNDVDATMFTTGEFARTQPDYLRRLSESGFQVGVHDNADGLGSLADEETFRRDIRESVTSIEDVIGRPIDPYLTSNAANTDERVRAAIVAEGFLPVGWGVAPPDWMPNSTEGAVYRAVVDNVYPGAIVRMHLDGPATEDSTAMALPRIIDELRTRGYEFVTIGKMLEPCPGPAPALPETVTMSGLDVHGLHCKAAPGPGGTLIRILFTGDTVRVRGPVFDGWLPVECAGRDGWIKADAVPFDSGASHPRHLTPPTRETASRAFIKL
jgi:peptidoglycan/xylan/chitin deacetylase (PgdA/CDA1 family)